MTRTFRTKTLATAVALALAPWIAPESLADSATGNDTFIGNALNPRYPGGGPWPVDPEGDFDKRSPTGLLNLVPLAQPEEARKTQDGWQYSGWAELGGFGGDADKANAMFRMYTDWHRGLTLNQFAGSAEHAGTARYADIRGGAMGRSDQYYELQVGRYNDWKVRAFWNETPHVFTTTYRTLWEGVGTNQLTLVNTPLLVPGGGTRTAAQVATAAATFLSTQDYSELAIVREEGGVRFEKTLSDSWSLFASYSNEARKGARPFAAVWGGGGGSNNVEIPESIDYTTHDLAAGIKYHDRVTSLNVQASAQYFRNNFNTMTWQNPMAVAPLAGSGIAAGSFTTGTYDLVPDNDYYNLKAEFARALPGFLNGRFTAVASIAKSEQDDELVPYMSLPGLVINGVQGGQWNTTNSLSKKSAGAEVESRLLDLGLALNPMKDLNLKFRARYYETENSTEYWACNPLTGQWGRVLNDGTGSAVVTNQAGSPAWPTGAQYCDVATIVAATTAANIVPGAGNQAIRNIPFDYEQTNYGVNADYRLGRTSTLNASFEQERYDRHHRERDETTENRFKIGFVERGFSAGTLRLSYENASRTGSEYISDPYVQFVSESLGVLPRTGNVASWIHVLGSFRKFDLADRDQQVANARFNLTLVPMVDAGISAQWKDIKYPDSSYGRTDMRRQNSVNLDLGWTPSVAMSAYGFYSYQTGNMDQASIWPSACTIGTGGVTAANFIELCESEGGPLYPLNRAWRLQSKDRNDSFGAGLRYDFGKALLDLNYLYTKGRTSIAYQYDPAGLANNITAAQRALAGSGMPDLETKQTILDANLLVPVTKSVALRFYYRYERGSIRDWHYDGVDANPAAGNVLYLDSGPQDYKANVFGVLVRVAL